MKKLPLIAEASFETVMDEMSKEVTKVMAKTPSKEERIAFSVFRGTLTKMALGISDDLSIEGQEDVLTVCGAWLNIGMLAGRSPKLLLDILKRTNAKIDRFTPPEWFMEKDKAIAEAEEIVRHYDTD